MFEVIEQLSNVIYLPSEIALEAGDIVALSPNDGISCILSSSRNPFGLVSGGPNESGFYPILFDTAIIRTSLFDRNYSYSAGDFLYSTDGGRLTKHKQSDDSLLLAHVLAVAPNGHEYIEINWI